MRRNIPDTVRQTKGSILKAIRAKKVDFRLLAVTPILIGILMQIALLIPASRHLIHAHGGHASVMAFGILGMLLLFNSNRIIYGIAYLFHKALIEKIRDFIVVELEPAKTYNRIKLVSDDMGILFYGDKLLYLRTMNYVYELEPDYFNGTVVSASISETLKGIKIVLPVDDVSSEWIIKPLAVGKIEKTDDPDPKIPWFHSRIREWTASRG